MTDGELARTQQQVARMFVSVARETTSHHFNFTERDLEPLESFVDRLWDPVAPPAEAELDSTSKLIGAYLGETMVRVIGGKWRWHGDRQIPALFLMDRWAFVLDAAYKRQVNRTSGSLIAFYQRYRELAADDRARLKA